MKPDEIPKALRDFTERERIEFLPPAPDGEPVSDYAPIHKYALDLKNGAKPELLKNPRDVKERAALEVFIARELYGLSIDDWKHLTGTFTFGSGATKAELDEIIRQSLALWRGVPDEAPLPVQ